MDPSRCVVIELEQAGEECFLNYLIARKEDYNLILKESIEDPSKVKACVWWRRGKEFFNTPLRSFLKRLKNKRLFDGVKWPKPVCQPKILGKMSTEKGVEMVCKSIPGSITKYHLEIPLYPYLSGLIPGAPPYPNEDSNEVPPTVGDCERVAESGSSCHELILQKLNQIHEAVESISGMRGQINRLCEAMDLSVTHGAYSDYDPPRTYPDPVICTAQDLVEPDLSYIPPVEQYKED